MKKLTPIFNGIVKDGKLILHDKDKFNMYLSTLSDEVEVIVRKPKKPTRSGNQNRYMWAVPYKIISEETGYTTNEVHEWCRINILAKNVIPEKCMKISILGEEIINIPSTTKLTTEEMEAYLREIRQWASQRGWDIPLPREIDDEYELEDTQ